MTIHNPNCDGLRCALSTGQTRVLPLDRLMNGAHLIVCFSCFMHEISNRKARAMVLGNLSDFDIPKWEDLQIYEPCAL